MIGNELNMETIDLKEILFKSEHMFPAFIENTELYQVQRFVGDIVIGLKHRVYGKELIHKHEVKYEVPKNWWEHLRKSLGLKYKSVTKFSEVEFKVAALFPDIEVLNNKFRIQYYSEPIVDMVDGR